jgi:hypothetical protein
MLSYKASHVSCRVPWLFESRVRSFGRASPAACYIVGLKSLEGTKPAHRLLEALYKNVESWKGLSWLHCNAPVDYRGSVGAENCLYRI